MKMELVSSFRFTTSFPAWICWICLIVPHLVVMADITLEGGQNATNHSSTASRVRRQAGGCNYNFQFNRVGERATLRSPGYPNSYGNNIDCRYTISSPAGTRMTLDCTEFNLEPSQNCQYDVFFFSPSGDTSFRDQQHFCGAGGFSRQTSGNRLAIGFHSDDSNPQSNVPFRFQCQIAVVSGNGVSSGNGNQQQGCSCGVRNINPQSRIVGGQNAGVGEFPWRCALYSRFLGVFCGCSIISQNWVLSAAHCTNGVQPGDQIYVNVGDHDLSTNDEATNQLIPVDYHIQNNMYDDQTQDADIALLRLRTPLTFTRNVAPVCLPWKYANADFDGQRVVASGWGSRFYGSGISSVLQKADDLPVLNAQRCSRFYTGTTVTITNNMICTYDPPRDTCQGDSGTSVDWRDPSNGRYYGLGVTSAGVGCGAEDHPGVYSSIPRFLNWIQSNTRENFCRI